MECPFPLDSKNTTEFEETDPYNPENVVRGFIRRSASSHYGSLFITHVNGEPVPQVVASAPKQHYPFDTKGRWDWPDHDRIEIYEKLDGTCIIGYAYKDGEGNRFVTYKTRLRPFLGSGKFGNFKNLWDEMLERYPGIHDMIMECEGWNFMFELYGKRNHILVVYDVSLDTRMIFARRTWGDYGVEPLSLWCEIMGFYEVPHLQPLDVLPPGLTDVELQDAYLAAQRVLGEQAIEVDIPEGSTSLTGALEGIMEGQVWYLVKGAAIQRKCKPEQILDYHWKKVDRDGKPRIPFHSIYVTVINALEQTDDIDYTLVRDLLLEEFDEDMVERARGTIEKIIREVIFERRQTIEIIDAYKEMRGNGLNIMEQRGPVMQAMAARFCDDERSRKQLGTKIFNLLMAYEEGQ